MRICTGEVCVRISSRSRNGLRCWFDDQRVLRVARGMAGREVQRFEVVEVGFDFGTRPTEYPIAAKTLTISCMVLISGCSAPRARHVPGRVMSMVSSASVAGLRSSSQRGSMFGFEGVEALTDFASRPYWSALSTSPTRVSSPCLRPIQRIRNCSRVLDGDCLRRILVELRQNEAEEAIQRGRRVVFQFRNFLAAWFPGTSARKPDHSATGLERDSLDGRCF